MEISQLEDVDVCLKETGTNEVLTILWKDLPQVANIEASPETE
jgi:hypothetical protein